MCDRVAREAEVEKEEALEETLLTFGVVVVLAEPSKPITPLTPFGASGSTLVVLVLLQRNLRARAWTLWPTSTLASPLVCLGVGSFDSCSVAGADERCGVLVCAGSKACCVGKGRLVHWFIHFT